MSPEVPETLSRAKSLFSEFLTRMLIMTKTDYKRDEISI